MTLSYSILRFNLAILMNVALIGACSSPSNQENADSNSSSEDSTDTPLDGDAEENSSADSGSTPSDDSEISNPSSTPTPSSSPDSDSSDDNSSSDAGDTDSGDDDDDDDGETTNDSSDEEESSDDGDETSVDPPTDCENLPPFPSQPIELKGPGKAEDFAFDKDGFVTLIAGKHLLKFDSSGTKTVVAPNVISTNAHGDETSHGLALLPNGDIVFADSGENALKRITKNGAVTKIIGDIPFPNGVIVDRKGMVYVSLVAGKPGEQPGMWEKNGSMIRVDPDTGDYDLLGEKMNLPNGLAFSPDYKTLYICQHDSKGSLLALDTETDEITLVKDGLGNPGGLDGLTVDECGNVYIATGGKVWRITPELEVETVMSGLGSGWIPNQHFGSGIGGWNEKSLYVIDYQRDSLYEIPLGVRGVTPPNLE